jgi:tyrosyl-tRNA synthetase
MDLKKALSRSIVTDFHSPQEAAQAEQDWVTQHQKGQTPDHLETIQMPVSEFLDPQALPIKDANGNPGPQPLPIPVDKLVSRAGLAASRTDAARKLKEGAVKINGAVVAAPIMELYPDTPFVLQVGRKMKRVTLSLL